MTEIRFQVADDWIDALRKKIGATANTDVAHEALTLFNWAAEERLKGRVILSAELDGKNVTRLVMVSLDNISGKT